MKGKGEKNTMTFLDFFTEYIKDYDVWNMSLDEYNYHKRQAKQIYESMIQS